METLNTTYRSGILEQRLLSDLLEAEVTAGAGTLEQKSWSLIRPVTLIGLSHHAHIRIEGQGIEPVHAALLNTADAIILADLDSRAGIFFANQKVKTRVLQPGESFRLGTCLLRVDLVSSANRHTMMESLLSLPTLVTLTSTRGLAGEWSTQAVGTVIGSREGCDIRLESKDVLPQHALLSRVGRQVVLASLAADKSIRINSNTVAASVLENGDTLTIWPTVLRVSMGGHSTPRTFADNGKQPVQLQERQTLSTPSQESSLRKFDAITEPAVQEDDPATEPAEQEDPGTGEAQPETGNRSSVAVPAPHEGIPATPPGFCSDIPALGSRLTELEEQLVTSARQLRQWQEQLELYAAQLVRRDAALAGRAKHLDDLQTHLQEQEGRIERRARELKQI